MEISRQKKNIRIIFLVLGCTFLFLLYLVYSYFLDIYNQNISKISDYYPHVTIFQIKDLLSQEDLFITIGFVVVVFLSLLLIAYIYIVYAFKHNNKKVLHIIDEINNDKFVPSVLEGEYGILEQKVYNMKNNNDRYVEELEKEKQLMNDYIENIAHQIKTPLTAIRLNEEILAMEHENPLLDKNQQSFERIDHLLESLLKLTRLEHDSIHFDLQLKDMRSLMESVVYEMSPLLDQTQLHVQVKDCLFYYDEQWLKEALCNIIKNGIEEKVNDIYLENQVYRNSVVITIKDNGKGIFKEDLPHLFERFYRGAKKKRSGSGIGLALCKEIVEKHHGHIHVYNDQGAIFEISMPLLDVKEKGD
ncbi:MAG: sensor histidine kinase [Faecalibacillus sp.]